LTQGDLGRTAVVVGDAVYDVDDVRLLPTLGSPDHRADVSFSALLVDTVENVPVTGVLRVREAQHVMDQLGRRALVLSLVVPILPFTVPSYEFPKPGDQHGPIFIHSC
jgi:hypothetical protein